MGIRRDRPGNGRVPGRELTGDLTAECRCGAGEASRQFATALEVGRGCVGSVGLDKDAKLVAEVAVPELGYDVCDSAEQLDELEDLAG